MIIDIIENYKKKRCHITTTRLKTIIEESKEVGSKNFQMEIKFVMFKEPYTYLVDK